MSLNGLDEPEVVEASHTAVIEPAGWFILKYVNRDSVALLGRGKGGVADARQAIAQYADASPLYGLIMYRRRKILIKYIPEGTSRLLQARTAVHLQDILERYSPYETLLEITTSEDLNDTALAASFPLHTASQSVASNRLREISEDGEEGGSATRPQGRQTAAQRYQERRAEQVLRADRSVEVSEKSPPPSIQVTNETTSLAGLQSPSDSVASPMRAAFSRSYLARDDSGHQSISSIGTISVASATDYAASVTSGKDIDSPSSTPNDTPQQVSMTMSPLVGGGWSETAESAYLGRLSQSSQRPSTAEIRLSSGMPDGEIRRPSTTSTRDSLSDRPDFDEDDPYGINKLLRPKVKLGPRPVTAGERTKRSMGSGVASVPATYRPQQQRKSQLLRSPSQERLTAPGAPALPAGNLMVPPPIPNMPEYDPRPVSRGSIKSLPSHKSTAMTPDKLRLMKAVELRKRKLRQSKAPDTSPLSSPTNNLPVPTLPEPMERVPEEPTAESIHPPVSSIDELVPPTIANDSAIEIEPEKAHGLGIIEPEEIVEPVHSKEPEVVFRPDSPTEILPLTEVIVEPRSPETLSPPTPPADMAVEPAAQPHAEVLTNEAERTPSIQQEVPDLTEPVVEEPFVEEPVVAEPVVAEPVVEEPVVKEPVVEEPVVVEPVVREPQTFLDLADDSSDSSEDEIATVPTVDHISAQLATDVQPPAAVKAELVAEEEKPLSSGATTPVQLVKSETSQDSDEKLAPVRQSLRRQPSELARRRGGALNPLGVQADHDASSSDEELLDELDVATFEAARSITVSKSPVATFFNRRPSATSGFSETASVRTIPSDHIISAIPQERFVGVSERFNPSAPSAARAPTQPTLSTPADKADAMGNMRRNVSTGISKRIQALAEQSSRESSFDMSRERTPSAKTLKPSPGPYSTSQGSTRETLDGQMFTNGTQDWSASRPQSVVNRDSISVSARIVRTASDEQTETDLRQDNQFRQSQLVINHASGETFPTSSNPPMRSASRTSTTSTSSVVKTTPSYRRSFTRQRAPSSIPSPPAEDVTPPPTHSTTESVVSGTSNDSSVASSNGSRTSRFFKRMSSLGGKRSSATQQGLSRATYGSSPPSSSGTVTMPKEPTVVMPAIVLGNLNVQFPDTLLWKRRDLSIDESGFITFSIPQAMEHQRNAAKRFALTDFRQPYIPDLDRQELPNSVMLDFIDGTTLQAACEDAAAQKQVIGVLRNYWKAWASID